MKEIDLLPNNLDEAVDILKTIATKNIGSINNMSENEFMSNTHFQFGMFIRNSWYLWWHPEHNYDTWPDEKPKLIEWFNSIGITHADDMSGILMTCLYRNIRGIDYNLDEQVEKYKTHWRENGYPDGIPKMY